MQSILSYKKLMFAILFIKINVWDFRIQDKTYNLLAFRSIKSNFVSGPSTGHVDTFFESHFWAFSNIRFDWKICRENLIILVYLSSRWLKQYLSNTIFTEMVKFDDDFTSYHQKTILPSSLR